MTYYPVNLNIHNRKCLVVGGGSVGTRKAASLLECGAAVTVVGSTISEKLRTLAGTRRLIIESRAYRPSDLDGMYLVIGATNDRSLNQRISRDADHRGILCNIADQPERCTFILPSVIRRGDLVISISTSGRSPALSKKLRKELEKQFGEEYAEFLKLMGAIRHQLLSRSQAPATHREMFEELIGGGLLDLVRDSRTEDIDRLLQRVLGTTYRYADLMKTT
ncbi:MAG: siroheme synthase [Deltaproteobacteria bacterium SG8_13]|nr:MAG: siroheme synthase [Deltaproteobacteria bacterium SG8_13]